MKKNVLEILNSYNFSFSVEIIPPRNGVNFLEVFEQIKILSKEKFQFISVTHGAGGSLRGGTLPICHFGQNQGNLLSIAHLTCRGVTKEDLENSLIDHHYFEIHNILALRGDPPDGINTDFKKTPGGFSYAYELIELIHNMNKGRYLLRKNFDDTGPKYHEGMPTNFCIGAACYPEDKNGQDIEYLKMKKEKGAHFGITQMIYDFGIFQGFYKKARNLWGESFPIILGLRIPYSFKQLERMKSKFQINVPDSLFQSMRNAEANALESKERSLRMQKVGVDWTKEIIEKAIAMGVRGVHFFIMGKVGSAVELKRIFDKK